MFSCYLKKVIEKLIYNKKTAYLSGLLYMKKIKYLIKSLNSYFDFFVWIIVFCIYLVI